METPDIQNDNVSKSKREAFLERLRASNPDANLDDDESIFEHIGKGYDEKDAQIGKYKEESDKFIETLNVDPRMASMLMQFKSGKNPVNFLMEEFGDDFKNALEDPNKKEEFATSYQSWLDKVANDKKLAQECDDNLDATLQILDEYQKEKELTPEQSKEIFDAAYQIILDGIYNKVSKETFDMVAKGLNYDTDIIEKERLAKLQGRNAVIEEKLKSEDVSELPPSLGGGNGGSPKEIKKEKYNPWKANGI